MVKSVRAAVRTLLLILIAWSLLSCSLSTASPELHDYLSDHATELSLDNEIVDSGDSFLSMNSYLDDSKVFLLGESHGVADNYDLAFQMVDYLYRLAGVRYYLAEIGYASAFYVNRYLETGDEALLDRVMALSEGSFSWTKEKAQFIRSLREYNISLPASERIVYVGIDIEHQIRAGFWLLEELMPAEEPPAGPSDEVSAPFIDLRYTVATDDYTKEGCYDIITDLDAILENNETASRSYLGSSYEEFSFVVDNCAARYASYDDSTDFQSVREKRMIDNFRHVVSGIADPEPRFFGLWGAAHIHQRSWNNDTWLAQRLQEEDDFGLEGNVVSIKIFYDESHSLLKNPYRIGIRQSERSIVNILGPFTTKAALFHLADAGSPFATTSTLIIDGNGGVTTDYFQFCVLLRGAEASTPYGD